MNNMDKIFGTVSNSLGVDKSDLKNAVSSGSTEKLMSMLSVDQAQKLNRMLSDKAATKKLLESEQVQQLIRKLSEDK